MTKTEFLILCEEYTIHPSVALDDEEVVQALRGGNDEEVKRLFEEEF